MLGCMIIVWVGLLFRIMGVSGYNMIGSICVMLSCMYLDMGDISTNLIILTTFLIPISILCDNERYGEICSMYLVLEGIIMGVFLCEDMLSFFILFEGVLIPMFIMIGVMGKRERRSRAGWKLLLYTIVGSIWFLLGILLSYMEVGVLDNDMMSLVEMDVNMKGYIWILVFIGMMVKVPLIPVHLWLGEAHVEASTGGSVLLAGILLKLGGYGIIRYNMNVLGGNGESMISMINVLCILGIVYCGIISIRQSDIKRIIAYGSISHMSLIVLGILSGMCEGLVGGMLQMISHGIVSSGLFICAGIIYERIGSREISYVSGLLEVMPKFGLLYCMLILGNIALPGTSSFVGEFICLVSIFNENMINGVLASSSMVIGVCYSLWMYNRTMFGGLSNILVVEDLRSNELLGLLVLVLMMLIMGIYPNIIL